MKKIIIKENFAFIYLNNNFYEKNIILKTIKEYNKFFKTKISKSEKYYILKIEKQKKQNSNSYSLKILTNEFLNYLLANQKIK